LSAKAPISQRSCVWFSNGSKGLTLNRTNNRTIRGAFGDDTAGWTGKVIEVFPTQADFRGHLVGALRVRIPPPKEATAAATLNSFAAPSAQEVPATTKPAPAAPPEPESDPDLDNEIPD
jgi:hypothetical protein